MIDVVARLCRPAASRRRPVKLCLRVAFPFLCCVAAASRAPASPLVPLPTDVDGLVTGAAAVGFDPSLAGATDGLELAVRRGAGSPARGFGTAAVQGVVPMGPARLLAGYERSPWFGAGASRATLGLAWQGGSWQAGWALRRLRQGQMELAWRNDVAVSFAPSSWLRLVAGLDNLGSRTPWALGATAPAPRFGLALRPRPSLDALILAASAGFGLGQRDGWRVQAAAFVPIVSGLEAIASWQRESSGQQTVNIGLAAAIGAWDGQLTGALWSGPTHRPWPARLGAGARWQRVPSGPRLAQHQTALSVSLGGNLSEAPRWLWPRAKQRLPLPLALQQLAAECPPAEVVLQLDALEVGMAQVEELVDAVRALRAAGTEVEARLVDADARTYVVAASCTRIRMDPSGQLDLTGFASHRLFWGQLLARLGLRVEAARAGAAKTGADHLAEALPRPAEADNREPVVAHGAKLLTRALCEGRKLSPGMASQAQEQGFWPAREALSAGLVDFLSPAVDVERGDIAPLPLPPPLAEPPQTAAFRPPYKIVVVPIVGLLGDVSLWPGELGVDEQAVHDALWSLQRDDSVAAIVLRVDSPGGDAAVAERLWRSVRRARAHKPLIASLGDVAASGGYYVACGADHIVAEPGTITGSIGVYRLKLDASSLARSLGIYIDAHKAGAHAGADSVWQPWSPADRERAERAVKEAYEQFLSRVEHGRHLSRAATVAAAEGQVWLGEQALPLGLIDGFGGLAAAVERARAAAGLSERMPVQIEQLGARADGLFALAKLLPRTLSAAAARPKLGGPGQSMSLMLWPGLALLGDKDRQRLAAPAASE